jgi:glycerophosphoryl diester phosphodiesterase
MIPLLPDRPRPLLYAHRGCSSLAPENTFAAFSLARKQGSPGLELDIHLAATGELVVTHDDTFSRTAGDPRTVENLSWDEIKNIDVGSYFEPAPQKAASPSGESPPSFPNERVPLLESVLEEFCPSMYIDIEMKTRKTRHDQLPLRLAEKLRSLGDRITQAVSVSSFNPLSIKAFKKVAPLIPAALIWSRDRAVPFLLRRGQGRWLCPCDYYKPEYLQFNSFARSLGYHFKRRPLALWVIDDSKTAKQLSSQGVEGIISNRPQDLPPEWRI